MKIQRKTKGIAKRRIDRNGKESQKKNMFDTANLFYEKF